MRRVTIALSKKEAGLVRFVGAQATVQFNALAREDRLRLLAGLQLVLEQSEFEQCVILEDAITEAERARKRASDAQLTLGEMFQ